MEELIHVFYSLLTLVISAGVYHAAIKLSKMYYAHQYRMKDFPKTYLIRYLIIPSDFEDSESEYESESDSEESLTLSFLAGDTMVRIAIITSEPSEIVKNIKQTIKFDKITQIFQLISYEELK